MDFQPGPNDPCHEIAVHIVAVFAVRPKPSEDLQVIRSRAPTNRHVLTCKAGYSLHISSLHEAPTLLLEQEISERTASPGYGCDGFKCRPNALPDAALLCHDDAVRINSLQSHNVTARDSLQSHSVTSSMCDCLHELKTKTLGSLISLDLKTKWQRHTTTTTTTTIHDKLLEENINVFMERC